MGVTVYRLQLGVEPVDGDADGVQHLVEQSPLGRFQVQSRDQCAVLLDRREVVQRSGVDVAEEAVDLSERTTTAYGVECSRRVVVDVLPQRHEHAVLLVGAGVDRPRRGNDLPAGPVEEGRDHELPLEGLSEGRAAIRYDACDERLSDEMHHRRRSGPQHRGLTQLKSDRAGDRRRGGDGCFHPGGLASARRDRGGTARAPRLPRGDFRLPCPTTFRSLDIRSPA